MCALRTGLIKDLKADHQKMVGLFLVRLAAHVSNGCKSRIRPSSGKGIAKTKGVVGDCESEGRWVYGK